LLVITVGLFRPKVNEISVFPQEVHQFLGSCESFTRWLLGWHSAVCVLFSGVFFFAIAMVLSG